MKTLIEEQRKKLNVKNLSALTSSIKSTISEKRASKETQDHVKQHVDNEDVIVKQ